MGQEMSGMALSNIASETRIRLRSISMMALGIWVLSMMCGSAHAGKLTSATEFLTPELKSEQADDLRNRGMLWVDQGAALWNRPEGPDGAACRTCHGDVRETMRGVAGRFPKFDAERGRLLNLEGQINACRAERQRQTPLTYESNELLGLTALISFHSRGQPKESPLPAGPAPATPTVDQSMAGFVEWGRKLWFERQGQLNLSCAQCHDDNVGRKLRGDTISSAVPTGYPAYRLEWDGMGSLHRRLKACQLGVRAVQFEAGSDEYLALEAYLSWRARGMPIEAPAMRR